METLAKTTVSNDLRKFLSELKATLESGGDLTLYMIKRAEQAEFEYGIRIDEANKRAELFGDIYTAVVIAAPLFIFSAVMLIALFGGTFAVDLKSYLNLGIFALIPGVNLIFLVLMEVLSPSGS
jgi:archaellum biogenesis protein FlaJ (TadC family)